MFDNQQQSNPQNPKQDSALGSQIQRLIDGFKSLKEKHAQLTDEHNNLKGKLSLTENDRDEKMLELEMANESITELETKKDELKKQIETLTEEKKSLGAILQEANQQTSSISEKLSELLPMLDEV
ncbi:MAG: hypothetical protein P9L91_01140 [Candidatus Zophobacter franzmannii]|nr:hypothetical protein [Candidatus Zophobacter franzmannii]